MSIIKNVLTFGASGRIDDKMNEFNELHEDYQNLYQEMDLKRTAVNNTLKQVIDLKVQSVKSLKKINKISKKIKSKNRQFASNLFEGNINSVDFQQIEETISSGEIAMNATKGVSAGVGTALGAWALVSTYGAASTGTAIASLSGVAATNATLAWFGGGALAAGGGGVAAGTAVLGGLVALPALALVGVFNHVQANKKIQEIEKKMETILIEIDQINDNLLKLSLINQRSEELIISLEKTNSVFTHEFKKVYKLIYPVHVISHSIKWIRKNVLRRNYFSQNDLKNIAYIGGIAQELALLVDTKVFE